MPSHDRRLRLVLLWFTVFYGLVFQLPCFGQATAGAIVGRVTDLRTRAVSLAAVEAVNQGTGLSQRTLTDKAGEYALPNLPPGSYSLTFRKEGFHVTKIYLQLLINETSRADAQLEIGPVSEEIDVVEAEPDIDTETATTGEVIQSHQILELPLLGRNFLDLARLTPGVRTGSGGNNVNLSVNGQREFANSVLVDGIESTTNRNNDTSFRPSVDSIQEFKVLTSGYAPEFGHAAGGVVAIQTKSGSNHFHGSAYEFFRPSSTAARDYFALEPPQLSQHNFGGTLGGPIVENKAFFFVSYERTRLRNAYSYLDSVPPLNQVRFLPNGDVDLSGLKDPRTGKQVPIFDPNSGQQFAGNVIPAAHVSPAGKATLLNLFPLPTLPGTLNGWFNNFDSRQDYRENTNTVDARMDPYSSERDRAFLAYHYADDGSLLGDRFAGKIPIDGGGDADYGNDSNTRAHAVSLAETHLISFRWTNDIRFGFTTFAYRQQSLLNNINLAEQLGVGNVNLPGFPQTSGFPNIYLGSGYSTGGSTYKPLSFKDQNFEIADDLRGALSRHQLRLGFEFRHLSAQPRFSLFPTGFQYYGGPSVSLTADQTYSYYDPNAFYPNGGSDIADLLLGLPLSVTEGLQLTNPTTESWETSAYLQDSWKVGDRLVFLYGVRYEFQRPYVEAHNRAANFDVNLGVMQLAGRQGNSSTLIHADADNFAPRFGFALKAAPRVVIHGGYGIYFSPENDARSDILTKNFPFAVEQTFSNNIYAGPPFTYYLDMGVPRITSVPILPGVSGLTPTAIQQITQSQQNVFSVDPRLRTGYSQLYSLGVQSKVTANTMLEAGYVGAASRRLPYAIENLNLDGRISDNLGQVQSQLAVGSSSFNSLQLKTKGRYAHATLLASYTFAKNMDNGPAPFNLGHNLNSTNQPQNPFRLSQEWSVADDDIRHNLVISYLYELPFGRGRRLWTNLMGLGDAVVGGWQLNGIFVAHSGTPINVVRGIRTPGNEGLRPDLVGDPHLSSSQRTLQEYFDVKAFDALRFRADQALAPGNAPRNVLRGPGFVNVDFSVLKDVKISEGVKLQGRAEFFNLMNTPHFANPVANMATGNFGSITKTVGNSRIIQFGVRAEF